MSSFSLQSANCQKPLLDKLITSRWSSWDGLPQIIMIRDRFASFWADLCRPTKMYYCLVELVYRQIDDFLILNCDLLFFSKAAIRRCGTLELWFDDAFCFAHTASGIRSPRRPEWWQNIASSVICPWLLRQLVKLTPGINHCVSPQRSRCWVINGSSVEIFFPITAHKMWSYLHKTITGISVLFQL